MFLEQGFGTEFGILASACTYLCIYICTKDSFKGICDWITPNATHTDLDRLEPGSETGSNNGLRILMDAETFDYGATTT